MFKIYLLNETNLLDFRRELKRLVVSGKGFIYKFVDKMVKENQRKRDAK